MLALAGVRCTWQWCLVRRAPGHRSPPAGYARGGAGRVSTFVTQIASCLFQHFTYAINKVVTASRDAMSTAAGGPLGMASQGLGLRSSSAGVFFENDR
jgi:hypothetical protein